MTFENLGLSAALLKAVAHEGYSTPTPIQVKGIPPALEGRDVLGLAQTGTGKTAAFALPCIQHLSERKPQIPGRIRCLVVAPTRELATQVGDSFAAYGRHTSLRHTVIFGGVGQDKQTQALRRGVDILVATPGRLLDLMQQKIVRLDAVEILVLDEADRMLDMGFIRDVKKIIAAVPKKRQTLFFSATMPHDVQDLVRSILVNPVRVEVVPAATTAEKVDQRVYFVAKDDKRALIVDLLRDPSVTRALVFTRTKNGANRLVKHLTGARIEAEAIHGNKSQNARERALAGFRSGELRVLVATDIAARGIDVDNVSHVVNFELPNVPETYVHRIGRTARAGASGIAISLCDGEERAYLKDIERITRQQVPVITDHAYSSRGSRPASSASAQQQQKQQRGGQPQQRREGGAGGERRGGRARGRNRGGGGGRSASSSGSSGGGHSHSKQTAERPAANLPKRPALPKFF